MKPYKVLVCGSRYHADPEAIEHVLDAYLAKIGSRMLLINGGAPGADDIARAWAVSRHVDHLTLYAKWGEGKQAGFVRNLRMLSKKPRLVLAFYWGTDHPHLGTKHIVENARKANIKVKEFKHG